MQRPAEILLAAFLCLPASARQAADTLAFHEEGLFRFYCTMHQPVMSGQILVLPPRHDPGRG